MEGGSVWLYARFPLPCGLGLAVRGRAWGLLVGGTAIRVQHLAAKLLRGYMRTA